MLNDSEFKVISDRAWRYATTILETRSFGIARFTSKPQYTEIMLSILHELSHAYIAGYELGKAERDESK